MFCVNCGKENEDTSRFCISCGKALSTPPKTNPTEMAQPLTGAQPSVTSSLRYDAESGETTVSTAASETTETSDINDISYTIPTGMTMNNPNHNVGSFTPSDDKSLGMPINPAEGAKDDPNIHVGEIDASKKIDFDKPINPNQGIDLTGYVPPAPPTKHEPLYTKGHMAVCVIIITILAAACGVFASLFFTTYAKYNALADDYSSIYSYNQAE